MKKVIRYSLIVIAASLTISISNVALASTSVFISVNTPPPALPVYDQPLCPGPGYVWTPGYWAWDGGDYYWVDGTWALAPVGMLWTPGYWGWNNAAYVWHAGYWGPHVGYYGGINYGHGYVGNGYRGGYWRDRTFFYNDTVNHVDVTRVHNVYHKTVINHVTVNRVSYNGGHGGTSARPNARDQAYAHEHHVAMTHDQRGHAASIRAQHQPPGNAGRSADHPSGHDGDRPDSRPDRHAAAPHPDRGAQQPHPAPQDRPEPRHSGQHPQQPAHTMHGQPPASAAPPGNAQRPSPHPHGGEVHRRPAPQDQHRGQNPAH